MRRAKCDTHALPTRFEGLSRLRALRPISGEGDLRGATDIANRLSVMDQRSQDQEDYLDTLSLLIEQYETAQHPINTAHVDAIGTLRFLMDQHEMSASDLGRLLGQRELGPLILRGDRELSKSHIRKLCAHFQVGPGAFLKIGENKSRRGQAA